MVDRCAESDQSDTEYFDAHEFAASLTSSDEYFEAPDRLDQQQTPEPLTPVR